ncbi:hypothetical protein LBMAG49_09420 [Planctomycetota bacterium]|nr:hypothetical protein LBMAG49_09420 [Planctomycetota bacterium]
MAVRIPSFMSLGFAMFWRATREDVETDFHARARMVDVAAFQRAFPNRIGDEWEDGIDDDWRNFKNAEWRVFDDAEESLREEFDWS